MPLWRYSPMQPLWCLYSPTPPIQKTRYTPRYAPRGFYHSPTSGGNLSKYPQKTKRGYIRRFTVSRSPPGLCAALLPCYGSPAGRIWKSPGKQKRGFVIVLYVVAFCLCIEGRYLKGYGEDIILCIYVLVPQKVTKKDQKIRKIFINT